MKVKLSFKDQTQSHSPEVEAWLEEVEKKINEDEDERIKLSNEISLFQIEVKALQELNNLYLKQIEKLVKEQG